MAPLSHNLMAQIGLASHTAMTNLDVALEWARQGYHVFPCYGGGPNLKRPLQHVKWRHESTINEIQIMRWWSQDPDAVPGIDMAKAGRIAIDCDRKAGQADGVQAFLDLAAANGYDLADAPTVATPNHGLHYYFQQWGEHGNGRGTLPPGIDVRGAGGYVIAPGATFMDGRRYEIESGHLNDAPEAPIWLIETLEAHRSANSHTTPTLPATVALVPAPPVDADRRRLYGQTALEEECRTIAAAHEGARNETINLSSFRIGQLVGGECLTKAEALIALTNAARSLGLPPRDKVFGPSGTIARGLDAGARNPRGPEEGDCSHVVATITRRVIELSDGGLADAETGEILPGDGVKPDSFDADELPEHLTHVPGLLGDITRWITDTARRPQPALALGAALTLLGTACGRHLAGPTGSGTHLYVLGLARTGAGKDHALQQIATILEAARMRGHIGPSQFISMPSVINYLVRSPLGLCAMDEFGSFMKRINNRKASGFEGAIGGILRTAWGTSFRPLTTPEWAGRPSETILAPALSIYAASTAEEFYAALEGGDTSNGVLNRLLIIETKRRPSDQDPVCDPLAVPTPIINGMKALYERQGPMVAAQLNRFDMRPPMHAAIWGAGAREAYRALVDEINRRCDGDVQAQAFYARTAEMAVRMATILAAGVDPARPVVERAHMLWATEVALWSARTMQRGAQDYISDSDNQSAANLVRRVIGETGRIKHRDLLRRLNHRIKTRDLDDILRALEKAEQITREERKPQNGGTISIWYSLPGNE